MACGTGATAAALAAAKIYELAAPVIVKVKSGDTLKIDFKQSGDVFTDIRMLGPAQHIFSGAIHLKL